MKNERYKVAHELIQEFRDASGASIYDHSCAAPFLLVLLRHVGCPFCREALHELSQSLKHINGCGYRVGLVHMDPDADMQEQLGIYGLQKLPRFHDPERKLYRAFGLHQSPLISVFNKQVWKKGRQAKARYGAALPKSNPMQLPGAFLIDQGVIIAGECTLSPDEHPDFLALLIRSEAVA
ncbi:MAG TPA: redoxin domain-containing protein [Kiritimatiellia bacterium]|nr:redoxin domain-containing protein [Kiritimatiellia bacterium]